MAMLLLPECTPEQCGSPPPDSKFFLGGGSLVGMENIVVRRRCSTSIRGFCKPLAIIHLLVRSLSSSKRWEWSGYIVSMSDDELWHGDVALCTAGMRRIFFCKMRFLEDSDGIKPSAPVYFPARTSFPRNYGPRGM
jgi:hypothetical protein